MQPDNTKGFTLLEVLVALAILAFALTALILTMTENTRNLAYLEEKTYAHWLAMNTVTEIRLGLIEVAMSPGSSTGERIYAGRQWRWSAQRHTTSNANTQRISVEVTNQRGDALSNLEGYMGP